MSISYFNLVDPSLNNFYNGWYLFQHYFKQHPNKNLLINRRIKSLSDIYIALFFWISFFLCLWMLACLSSSKICLFLSLIDWDYLKRSSLSVVAKYNFRNAFILKLNYEIGARVYKHRVWIIPKTPPTYPIIFIKLKLVLWWSIFY